MLSNINQIILKQIIIGSTVILLLIPSTIFAADPECAFVKWKTGKWGIPYPTWVECPSGQVCE